MCELSLEALGYTADEARVSRRAFDLTTAPEQRAASLRTLLHRSSDADARSQFAPPVENAA